MSGAVDHDVNGRPPVRLAFGVVDESLSDPAHPPSFLKGLLPFYPHGTRTDRVVESRVTRRIG